MIPHGPAQQWKRMLLTITASRFTRQQSPQLQQALSENPTTAPVDETTAPVVETTAPVVETTAPVVETTAPAGDTITVKFTDALNWGSVKIYYWTDGPAWPGTAMEKDVVNDYGQQVYKATIPAAATGVITTAQLRLLISQKIS